MGILLDTGFYLGLIHKKDENHKRSIELLHEIKKGIYGQIYTTNHVMDESATLCAIRSLRNYYLLQKICSFFVGTLQIAQLIHLDFQEEKKIWELFLKMNKHGKDKSDIVSFTDCSNIICCQNYRIDYILSFDSHFDGWIERLS